MRVAAFDCGTNTIKLLVADLDPETGDQHELVRDMRMVRLGQDVDRTGRLADEAMARTFAAIEEFAAVVATSDVTAMRFCATSAARDAENADEFRAGVVARLGIEPEVVSGDEEARLSFLGATRALADRIEPTLVIDIGGGSTECVMPDGHRSLDVGAVRVTERFLASDPPTESEVAEAMAFIEAELDGLPAYGVRLGDAATVVGVAGTITTMTAMWLDLSAYERSRIHRAEVRVADLHELADRLIAMTVDERRALPFMHPGRADVIGAGALILSRILARTDVTHLVASESDILDGIAWSLVP